MEAGEGSPASRAPPPGYAASRTWPSPRPAPGAPRTSCASATTEAFRAWLAHRDERELGTAYALGREAVSAQLSVLDLAETHHEAAPATRCAAEPDPPARAELIDAAGVFFGEALSTFEIAHRGYHEVQEVARLEHEHVDAAARARRGLGADQRVADDRGGAPAHRRGGAAGARRAPRDDLEHRRATRSPAALSAAVAGGRLAGARPGAPIGVMLRSAGRPLGMLEVADRPEREFTPRDEAILAQLGQLASVAIAKSQAYTRERHIAQVLQRSLLPPSIPTVPGLTAAVRFIAAGEGIEVGGDFYDLFRARATAASRR